MKEANYKVEGEKYRYMSSGDCYVYITMCDNCKQEIGGWSVKEADEKWELHKCKKQ